MLIGIDANEANLTRNRVGVNQYAFDLLHALHKLKNQHKFVVYLKDTPLEDMPKTNGNWSYRVIPFPKLWTQTRLPFDLYTHIPKPEVFFSMNHYSPRWSPIPTVVAIMDLGFLKTPDQFTLKDFNQLKSWTNYSVRQASHIIAISNYTKKDIIESYNVDPKKITVTHLGYDKSLFIPTNNPNVLSKYKISQPYLLFLGSLRPSKNILGLLQAFSDSSVPDKYQLVVAGKKGWKYDEIFNAVSKLNLFTRVVFPGFVDESDVPVLMTMSSAFIMPSFYEGFGIPILEAMACGTPVVVSKITSLPEVAGLAGIYIDPNDVSSIAKGITAALGSKREKFVQAGLKQVKSFDWAKTASQTLKVLESV